MTASGPVADAQVTGGARLADLESIRALAITYCHALDNEDVTLLKSVYWPEATDDHGSLFTGRAWDFADVFVSKRERVRPTMHVVFNHLVHFDENLDLAQGVVSGAGYQFAHALRPPRTRVVLGRYVDVYQRRSGEWRILSRRFTVAGTMTETAALPTKER